MNDLQLRLQLRATLQNTISEIMSQNQISATQMEDALQYVLLQLKDAALTEYANWAMEDKAIALKQTQILTEETEENVEEE